MTLLETQTHGVQKDLPSPRDRRCVVLSPRSPNRLVMVAHVFRKDPLDMKSIFPLPLSTHAAVILLQGRQLNSIPP